MSERRPWRVEIAPEPVPELAEALSARHVWRRLTRVQRDAIRATGADGAVVAHGTCLRALAVHGLVDERGRLTAAGTVIHRWAPEPNPAGGAR